MICRWAQELLGYHFSYLHRSDRMMVDVAGLTRKFGNIVAQHLCVVSLLHKLDTLKRPQAYNSSIANVVAPTKLTPSDAAQSVLLPILTTIIIAACITGSTPCDDKAIICINQSTTSNEPHSICSVPILLCHAPPIGVIANPVEGDVSATSKALQVADKSICNWL